MSKAVEKCGMAGILTICLSICAILVGGCGEVAPSYSVWAGFDREVFEPEGYAVYTYVLFGRDLQILANSEELKDRYQALLVEIAGSTSRDQEGELFPPSDTNLFSIPLKERDGDPTLENFDYSLSLSYVAKLAATLDANSDFQNHLRSHEGPFLISTRAPLRRLNSEDRCLLFADLTGKNSAGIAEIVVAYKKRFKLLDEDPCSRLRSFRLTLLDILLEADDLLALVVEVDMTNWFTGASDE